jgi:hypothetical protein
MNAPLISVVIASVNVPPSVIECLNTLTSQKNGIAYEVLVLEHGGEATPSKIYRRFAQSEVQFVPVKACTSIPKLRAIGIGTKTRMLAVLEDHCNVPSGLMPHADAAAVSLAFRSISDVTAVLGGRFPGFRLVRGPADARFWLRQGLRVQEARGRPIGMLEDSWLLLLRRRARPPVTHEVRCGGRRLRLPRDEDAHRH